MSEKTYFQKLKDKWGLESMLDVWIVLLVFALTGTTVLLIKRPVVDFFSTDPETERIFRIAYWILILPVYNVLLLAYGYVFGRFRFFWEFEKKMFRRMTGRK